MLLLDMEEGKETYDRKIEKNISSTLPVCSGLPLAVLVANRWIIDHLNSENMSFEETISEYAIEMNRINGLFMPGYGHVDKILRATLKHLEKWV